MIPDRIKLAKNSLIYALFTLLQRGFAFFLIPLYTTQLSTSEYGILGIVMAAIPFFVLIAGLALRGSTAYFYYQYKDTDEKYLKDLWGSSFIIILIFSILFSFILWITKSYILDYLLGNIPFYPYLLLALISVSTQPIYYYYQSILKAKQLAKLASVVDFLYFISIVLLTMFFILVLDFKAEGALLALAIANFIFFVYSLIMTSKQINFCFRINLLKRSLKYSLPIIPHNLSAWAMNLADRLILNNLTTLGIVGLFDIGSQLGKLINIITLGVNSAYSPWFFQQLKKSQDNKVVISEITQIIVLFYIVVSIIISWLAPELLRLIASISYYSAWKIVPFIAIAFAVNGFYYSFSNIFFLEKTKYLPFISIIGAIFNVGLNFLLIPFYGMMGAAITCLISKIIFTGIAYFYSQKILFVPYNINKISMWFIFGFIIAMLPHYFQSLLENNSIWFNVVVKLGLIVGCMFPFFWIKRSVIISLYNQNSNK